MNNPTCLTCDCVKGCQSNPTACPILLAECIASGQVSAAQIEAHRVLDAAIAQPTIKESLKVQAIAQPEQTALPESALHSLARRCLWIAYCWNDHNFSEAYTYARKTAQELGINDFNEANKWLVAQPEQTAVFYQFQTKDGEWHGFSDEAHRKNTVEAGRWLIRALYTAPQVAQPEHPAPVRQPLTHTEIVNLWATAVSSWIEVKQNPYTLFARSIEAAHGITTPESKK